MGRTGGGRRRGRRRGDGGLVSHWLVCIMVDVRQLVGINWWMEVARVELLLLLLSKLEE